MPRTQYVPVVAESDLVYSECALNTHVPVGARLAVGKATAIIKLGSHQGRTYLELRLDIPPGTTLVFEDDRIELKKTQASGHSLARFPSISLVDTPIVNSYSAVGAVRNQQLPANSPMIGGEVTAGSARSNRHFWLATYVQVPSAEAFELSLPPLVENGSTVHRVRVAFRARTVVAVAVLNC